MLTLRTERLILRDYRSADLADHHRLMSDEKTMYFLPDLLTHSLAESSQNLEEAMAAAFETPREKVFLAMELAEGGAYLGSVGYTVIDSPPPGKVVHAGYFMLPEHHGKGYMPEAVLALMRHAFEDDGVFRFETGCFADNRPSERVMQKCGMVREAHHRQCAWHDGKMRDRLLYSLLRNEWAARKA